MSEVVSSAASHVAVFFPGSLSLNRTSTQTSTAQACMTLGVGRGWGRTPCNWASPGGSVAAKARFSTQRALGSPGISIGRACLRACTHLGCDRAGPSERARLGREHAGLAKRGPPASHRRRGISEEMCASRSALWSVRARGFRAMMSSMLTKAAVALHSVHVRCFSTLSPSRSLPC